MKVYSLVGKSGTGKSFQANELCSEYGIDSIIDDGLLIVKGSIHAGVSAKRQATRITAIKTALFTDEAHLKSVMDAIKSANIESILIIGTSDKMINIITKRLGIGEPMIRFDIETLTTEQEREIAQKLRFEMGQHVIPVPTFQIKKDFSGYFLHPLRAIRDITQDIKDGRKSGTGTKPRFGSKASSNIENLPERSIVRPTYSYLGNYSISDRALSDATFLAANEVESVDKVNYTFIKNMDGGAAVSIGFDMKQGRPALEVAREMQMLVSEKLEDITSINILSIDIEIQGIKWPTVI